MFQESAVINQGEISGEVRTKIGEIRLHYFCIVLCRKEEHGMKVAMPRATWKFPFPSRKETWTTQNHGWNRRSRFLTGLTCDIEHIFAFCWPSHCIVTFPFGAILHTVPSPHSLCCTSPPSLGLLSTPPITANTAITGPWSTDCCKDSSGSWVDDKMLNIKQ